MSHYNLTNDGDGYEQHYYHLFIQNEFPHYEIFWQKFVTPLTRRPVSIQIKDDSELLQMGRTANDVCIVQLHYSVLRHLIRAYELRQARMMGIDHVLFGLSALCGAQDVAFELLERFQNPTRYDPWAEKQHGGILGGKEAQAAWKKVDNYPLQHIRDYRNNLIHGRMLPGIAINTVSYLPEIGLESKYFDWRKITNLAEPSQLPLDDFSTPANILQTAWQDTTQYLELRWKSHLIPNI